MDSDLSKVALVKNSLTGIDKTATAHLDKIADILDYVKKKYAKEDMVLSILMNQMKTLKEPRDIKQSLENIDSFVIIYSHLQEWGLSRHLNSPVRAELIKSPFCRGTTRWEFVKQIQLFEEPLTSVDLS